GEEIVVGVNKFDTTEPSPLQAEGANAIETIDPIVEMHAVEAIQQWRASRDNAAVEASLDALREAAKTDQNLVEVTLACARAGVTTGEWSQALRETFGEYRAPTGVSGASASGEAGSEIARVRDRVRGTGEEIGERL
ncbi:methylmalonyl-CoA mutase family protein, partial [Lentzea kentuckyensis]|uniref:methylmalonyl-CoA mutase family protein n=1 Tax=Lentzea kentuckyensis TaxID=360086 RepID=UPI003CCBC7D0